MISSTASGQDGGQTRRRRGKGALPFTMALVFHVALLIAILSTRAPPMGHAPPATEISLIRGSSMWSAASPLPAPPKPHPIAPVVETRAPLLSPVAAEAVKAPDAAQPLNRPAIAQSRVSLETLVTTMAKGGTGPTAEPVAISAAPEQTAAATSQVANGENCNIAGALQTTLLTDSKVKAALALIPAQSRSVANAIVLWDGRWSDPSFVGGVSAFEVVQHAVVNTINLSPRTCRAETIHGVRFVILADARDTIVLAFGSSQWRWGDVSDTFSPIVLK